MPCPDFPSPASVRMINRIHDDASYMGTPAFPSRPPGLSDDNIFMIHIADLSDRCHTGTQDLPHLTRFQAYLHVGIVTTHHLGEAACTSNQLATLTRLQFNIVNGRTERHAGKRKVHCPDVLPHQDRIPHDPSHSVLPGPGCTAYPHLYSEAGNPADRFGSYSRATTLAGIPVLSRRKSILR